MHGINERARKGRRAHEIANGNVFPRSPIYFPASSRKCLYIVKRYF